MQIANKHFIVSGAASGLGAATAQMLVEATSRPALQRFVAEWVQTFAEVGTAVKGVRWQLEIDPLRI